MKYKILLIDDEKDILELMEEDFRARNFDVHLSLNGECGIKKIKQESFDVVISDLRMPKASGASVCESLKSLENPPLFFLISAETDSPIVSSLKIQKTNIYQKPFSMNLLIDEVVGQLNQLKKKEGHEQKEDA